MKIAFNRQPRRSPWGGGAHFATTFADYLVAHGHEVVYKLEPGLDWIIMLDPRSEDGGFSAQEISHWKYSIDKNVKVLHRVNDTGVTRGGHQLDELILRANREVSDKTVFISQWVRNHFVIKGFTGEKQYNVVITNGCDQRYFYPNFTRSGVSSPIRLVTHHWSNNKNKGLDLYEHLDELMDVGANFEFTYVGRYPAGHVPKHTKIIAPLYGQALGDELRRHDVYVTAARSEACGSHHVEGAACGLPVIYHNDGGGVVEMCSRYGLGLSDVKDFPRLLEQIRKNYGEFQGSTMTCDLSGDTMCAKYLELMK